LARSETPFRYINLLSHAYWAHSLRSRAIVARRPSRLPSGLRLGEGPVKLRRCRATVKARMPARRAITPPVCLLGSAGGPCAFQGHVVRDVELIVGAGQGILCSLLPLHRSVPPVQNHFSPARPGLQRAQPSEVSYFVRAPNNVNQTCPYPYGTFETDKSKF
jgi:hypothetical protein